MLKITRPTDTRLIGFLSSDGAAATLLVQGIEEDCAKNSTDDNDIAQKELHKALKGLGEA